MKHVLLFSALFLSFLGQAQIDTLSDEFNRACNFSEWKDLDVEEGWNASHMEEIDVDSLVEGHMNMMPYSTAWFQNRRSNLYYKEVVGDFIFTTKVYATDRAEISHPGASYSLSGAMLRAPKDMTDAATEWSPGEENYVFLSLGFAATNHPSCPSCPGPHFEVKSTTNSSSSLNVSSIDTAAADIRIARIDNAIIVLYALPGEAFQVRQRYNRSDFPDTLQVGLVAYTDWNNVNGFPQTFHNTYTLTTDLYPDVLNYVPTFDPQIKAHFDYARFTELDIPTEFEGVDFLNANQVTDADLVSIFGFSSQSTDPLNAKIWRGSNSVWDDPSNWEGGEVPSSSDVVVIPNCSCPQIDVPSFNSSNVTIAGLIVEEGAILIIEENSVLTVENSVGATEFNLKGDVILNGELIVIE